MYVVGKYSIMHLAKMPRARGCCSCGNVDGGMNFELAFREYEKFVANDHCNPLDKYSKHVMYKVCVYACMCV